MQLQAIQRFETSRSYTNIRTHSISLTAKMQLFTLKCVAVGSS